MSYKYDIFISYARDPDWDRWVKDLLKALLRTFLVKELGREPIIFIDREMEPGSDWPSMIGAALGSARVLVAILDSYYFSRPFCLHELDLMLERLSKYPSSRLIIPIIGQNCDKLPDPIGRITLLNDRQKFDSVYNPFIQKDTADYFLFSKKVKDLTPDVAAAVRSAPDFDSNWVTDCTKRINDVFQAGEERRIELTHASLGKVAYDRIALPGVLM